MCQVSLLNLGKELNRLCLPPLLQINSTGNKDGVGFMYPSTKNIHVWKSAKSATDVDNLGLQAKKITGQEPVIGHVRSASPGVAVTLENAHPFSGKRFVLVHNGRLLRKDVTPPVATYGVVNDDASPSDSLEFLNALEALAAKKPKLELPVLLPELMLEFKGKFALIIYDSLLGKYYIARGSTADLHIVKVRDQEDQPVGFVVNTKRISLSDTIQIVSQIFQVVTGVQYKFDKIEELDKDSLYIVDGKDIVKVAEVKENPMYVAKPVVHDSQPKKVFGSVGSSSSIKPADMLPVWKLCDKISVYMKEHCLSLQDIDLMFQLFTGKVLADIAIEDLEYFVSQVIPIASAPKPVRKSIKAIMGEFGVIFPYAYEKVEGLEFPWMLSEPRAIASLREYLKKTYA